ncbi:MAG: hypothetical protein J5I94_08740 [Phaeodactylibacter sp.]|nr:hypothetical protein [Phaeodactylibacter sp.]
MPPLRYSISISLLAAAVIAFELGLMQVFSITQWYHFAYMAISVAMLGFGAAGTFLALFEKQLTARFEQVFPLLLFLCSMAMPVVGVLAQHSSVRFDTYLLFNDIRQAGRLLATYLLFFIPFFLAALAIGLSFVRFSREIGRLYFADLLGSGLGGLFGIGLMWWVFPGELPGLTALLPLIGGVVALRRPWDKRWWMIALATGITAAAIIFRPPRLQPSQYKSLSKALLLPEAAVELERSSPYGLIQVVSSPALRYAPALSLNYTGKVPVRKVLFNNGEWAGAIVPKPEPGSPHILDFTAGALAFRLQSPKKVLALQSGTGERAAQALAHGVPSITMVEENPVATALLREELAGETDSLVFHPAITVRELEGRTFLMADTGMYSLIFLPMASTFGGTAGLNAMQEQYLMTKEAFRDMWARLEPGGMISISTWMDYPLRNPLKILATLVEALAAEGADAPRRHLIGIRSWGAATFILKKSPVSGREVDATRAFCREMGFDPFLLPGLTEEERQRYNQLQDTLFFSRVDSILSPAREIFYQNYDFNVRPATDERPYFSQFLRWESLPALARQWGSRNLPFMEIGYLIVWLTFFQILAIALALIILPLFRIGFRSRARGWSLFYFGSLGLGFMFVEILLIQQFTLFLGKPIFATAATLSGLLIASGAGSWYSSRWGAASRKLWMAPLLIAVLLAVYAGIALPVLYHAIGLAPAAKLALFLLLIAPLGFLMGMPFPLGIRYLSEKAREEIPWAWGVNGYFSVISTALATIIAAELGFSWAIALAGAAYTLAGIASILKMSRQGQP